jgi:hypothetical protein
MDNRFPQQSPCGLPEPLCLSTCRPDHSYPAAAALKRLEGLIISPLGMQLREYPPEPAIMFGLLRRHIGLDTIHLLGGLGHAVAIWP